MEISDTKLNEFRAWLVERGRVQGTADAYVTNIRTCAAGQKDEADLRGLTSRLVAGKLAPNTLHANHAALSAWSVFTKNRDLQDRLEDIRLPPARRVRAKQPLALEDWRRAVRQIKTCRMRIPAMRHVLLIIALRGLRCGDVLRLRRIDAERALVTGKLVYEAKGRKRIEIDASSVKDQLKELVAIPGWDRVRELVSTSKNPKVAYIAVWRAARRTAKQIDIFEMNPHRYRHTFATNFLKQLSGDPNAIVKLQKYMGWENMATAARYVDSISQDELDKIGAGLVSGLID